MAAGTKLQLYSKQTGRALRVLTDGSLDANGDDRDAGGMLCVRSKRRRQVGSLNCTRSFFSRFEMCCAVRCSSIPCGGAPEERVRVAEPECVRPLSRHRCLQSVRSRKHCFSPVHSSLSNACCTQTHSMRSRFVYCTYCLERAV